MSSWPAKPAKTLPEIADYLRQTATALESGKFVEPPKILNEIADKIQRGEATDSELQETWKKLQKSIETEFCDEPWKGPILGEVARILDKGSPKFMEALRILQQTHTPLATCIQIMNLAANQTDILVRKQLECFAYLITIEGVYDNVMRFLYAIHKKRSARKSDLKTICDNLRTAKAGNAIIAGWHPIVRNAIAHASYSLDISSSTGKFEDQQSGKTETLSFDDLNVILGKVLHVGIAASTLVLARIMIFVAFGKAAELIKEKHVS